MADHGHHDPGGHELEAINTKLLFRLLISLSLVTLLAAAAVVQWFNSQRRELEMTIMRLPTIALLPSPLLGAPSSTSLARAAGSTVRSMRSNGSSSPSSGAGTCPTVERTANQKGLSSPTAISALPSKSVKDHVAG